MVFFFVGCIIIVYHVVIPGRWPCSKCGCKNGLRSTLPNLWLCHQLLNFLFYFAGFFHFLHIYIFFFLHFITRLDGCYNILQYITIL